MSKESVLQMLGASERLLQHRENRNIYENEGETGNIRVQPQQQHWQPICDPFKLTSPAQHALRWVISFWNFLA